MFDTTVTARDVNELFQLRGTALATMAKGIGNRRDPGTQRVFTPGEIVAGMTAIKAMERGVPSLVAYEAARGLLSNDAHAIKTALVEEENGPHALVLVWRGKGDEAKCLRAIAPVPKGSLPDLTVKIFDEIADDDTIRADVIFLTAIMRNVLPKIWERKEFWEGLK